VQHPDAAALATLRKADPVIAALIGANPDYDPDAWLAELPRMDAFGVLILQVIGQQLSVAVARTMLGRLLDRFGRHLPSPQELLAADPQDIRAVLGVGMDGSRRIWPAQVGCLVDPGSLRRIQKDRLDDRRGGR
jgi:3-methyladenine DNA glycosylase/8-oxoguanine DNA glycosylase